MNFLERLVAEWYAHQGYLVQTNFKFGPRPNGGYAGEMDVLAIKLKEHELIHIETSSDAEPWENRETQMAKKFATAAAYYVEALGVEFSNPRRIAVVGIRPPRKPINWQARGIEVLSIDELMSRIKTYLRARNPAKKAVSETYGYLRAVQFAIWFGSESAT